jgi:hypothetical protein
MVPQRPFFSGRPGWVWSSAWIWLYEAFRPEVPEGVEGWGAKGLLSLDRICGAGRATTAR